MSEKLRDYQVLDVLCGGTFYKVRHKVTNKIFAWKAYNCRSYSDEQIQNIVNDVKTLSKASSDCLLRYYDTILHAPTKTLYFVLEYNSWRSLQDLLQECKVTKRRIAEGFVWRLLHELARVCKAVANLNCAVVRKCICLESVFVSDNSAILVNCFDLEAPVEPRDIMRQIGEMIRTLCSGTEASGDKPKELNYSDDLWDIISFLTEDRSCNLVPDVVLYHPTVLTHLETTSEPKHLNDIIVAASTQYSHSTSELNKCDSEKVVELTKAVEKVEPLPRTIFNIGDSPIYCNLSPKRQINSEIIEGNMSHNSLSPTLAALALELPGYMPKCRKPYVESLEPCNRPQLVSEQTFSQEWMSRLVALRQREQSLNKRERDLLAKEIVSSPACKVIPLNVSQNVCDSDSNGITLPPVVAQVKEERREWTSRRRRRSRGRRKSYGYEDLDSSLSADAGDSSVIITATKFTKENMPRRNIFPEVSTKKVHFTPVNPFVESDESVTLTFYELEKLDQEEKRDQGARSTSQKDISQFKYLDIEKMASEKRAAKNWTHSSPSKQARMTKNVFNDISNHSSIRKTPSKTSLLSRGSDSSRMSMMSARSHWSTDSSLSQVSEGGIFERTRASIRQSVAQTPIAPDMKKKSRKSLIPFKTPFKFMSSAKY